MDTVERIDRIDSLIAEAEQLLEATDRSMQVGQKGWFQAVAKRLPGSKPGEMSQLSWNIFQASPVGKQVVNFIIPGKGYIRLVLSKGHKRVVMKANWIPTKKGGGMAGPGASAETGAAPLKLKPDTVARWIIKKFAKEGIWE
jgi:hypothetical protein